VIHALVAALLVAAAPVFASELRGVAASVADGDTLTLRDGVGTQHRIRLNGIDAPERGQPFSQVARKSLDELTRGRQLVATCPKTDRFGRRVCTVRADSQDVGLALIEQGLAWHFKRYEADQSPADRAAYAEAEHHARDSRRGLWSFPDPEPPWDWRAARAVAGSRTSEGR
jgi:endonuclease YncB( thermonuclease family)